FPQRPRPCRRFRKRRTHRARNLRHRSPLKMFALIVQRLFLMIPTLLIVSVLSFAIIQLPPGDFLTSYIAALEETGQQDDQEQIQQLRSRYHLDRPFIVQYLAWIGGILHGDLGVSFEWNRPVKDLIGERLFLTAVISFCTLLFTWAIAIPVGILSAVKQYSWFDYAFSLIGFIGLAIPNFLLALIFMYIGHAFFDISPGGLLSPEFENQPFSFAKFLNFLAHLWIPVVIIGT